MESKHIHLAQHNSCGLCCIKIKDITVVDGKDILLDNINIHMHCGEITAIIGPNGGGKTTLLKSIINENKHTGTIEYTNKNDATIRKPIIGYVPQKINVDRNVPITVKDLFNTIKTEQELNKIIELVEIRDLMNKRVGQLSGGEMQKVLIALAMYPFPDILLLDEPVANIDINGMKKVYNIVRKLSQECDIAIIIVSHDLENIYNYADNVILLNKKILVNGVPNFVYNSEEYKEIFE